MRFRYLKPKLTSNELCYPFPMDFYATGLWYSLGYATIDGGYVILLASVAWEALFGHLELGSKVLNVDCVVGTKSSIL